MSISMKLKITVKPSIKETCLTIWRLYENGAYVDDHSNMQSSDTAITFPATFQINPQAHLDY